MSEDGISVQFRLGISVHVEVDFIVAPGEFDFVQTWNWASSDWPTSTGSHFSDIVVFDFNIGSRFCWVQSFLDGESVAQFLLGFERRSNSIAFESTFGGQFKSIGFAGKFDFIETRS